MFFILHPLHQQEERLTAEQDSMNFRQRDKDEEAGGGGVS